MSNITSVTSATDDPLPSKKSKTSTITLDVVKPKIGTHDGVFHCDEVLACFMLQQLPAYADATIVRTRNADLLDQCDIVVDVGAVFDPSVARFDHHQRTFQQTLSTLRPELGADRFVVRLSSAGLIYTFYGEEVIREILQRKCSPSSIVDADQLRAIYLKLYETLIQEIDGIDNGEPMFNGEPVYRISSDLSSRVAHLNGAWNEDPATVDVQKQFECAKQLVGDELTERIVYYAKAWWPARALVVAALDQRFDVHPSGAILELEQFCPWKEHLHELEQERTDVRGQPKYVLMENKPGDFRVICVPVNPKSFVCRKFLHRDWRGVRDNQLELVSGVPGASFVHATGFIGGAKTRESALKMAVISLESDAEE